LPTPITITATRPFLSFFSTLFPFLCRPFRGGCDGGIPSHGSVQTVQVRGWDRCQDRGHGQHWFVSILLLSLKPSWKIYHVPRSLSYTLFCAISGVGKTSLLQRYTQNKFDPKNTTSTTGAFFVTKKVFVDGLKVRLQLWDTAGQERFRSMVCTPLSSVPIVLTCPVAQAPMYYRGANAALLLYDITSVVSFEGVRGCLEGKQ